MVGSQGCRALDSTCHDHIHPNPRPHGHAGHLWPSTGYDSLRGFFHDQNTALASASSAAPSVATISSVAFSSDSDLESIELSPPDRDKAVHAISEEVNGAIDRLYGELQLEQQGLAYFSHFAQDTVYVVRAKDDAVREKRVNGLWAAFWGSELGQRALD